MRLFFLNVQAKVQRVCKKNAVIFFEGAGEGATSVQEFAQCAKKIFRMCNARSNECGATQNEHSPLVIPNKTMLYAINAGSLHQTDFCVTSCLCD